MKNIFDYITCVAATIAILIPLGMIALLLIHLFLS